MSRAQRACDVAGAVGGLMLFSPVMTAIVLALWLDDGGPILFRQERLGYRRRPFEILKFRSMRDDRVTRAGRLLRASGLDELPQLINILRGDMSAVGPRPLTAADVSRLGWGGADCDFRWACRPGLTGLAQLAGARADDDALLLDRVHAERWRLALDCQLIAWSLAVNAFGKARVRRWIRWGLVRSLDARRSAEQSADSGLPETCATMAHRAASSCHSPEPAGHLSGARGVL